MNHDWSILWKRDPKLIPEGGELVDAIDPNRLDHAPWGKIPIEDAERLRAVLIRDAAVDFISRNGQDQMPKYNSHHNDWAVWHDIGKETRHPTREEALYIACESILNTRDSKKVAS